MAEGAKVVIGDLRAAEGEAVAQRLGACCVFQGTDVTVEEQVKALIALAVDRFGHIDCLFNNAGSPGQVGRIEEVDVERFDLTMATLVRSVVLGMKHAAPYMRSQGHGSIINTASIGGLRGALSMSLAYSVAKAAVIHLTRCVALDLGEAGVRVNSISPGRVATSMGMPVEHAEALEYVREHFKKEQPIPRAGLTDDIAYAALFLASDEATFVNGHDLVVDGGYLCGRGRSQQELSYLEFRKSVEEITKRIEEKAT